MLYPSQYKIFKIYVILVLILFTIIIKICIITGKVYAFKIDLLTIFLALNNKRMLIVLFKKIKTKNPVHFEFLVLYFGSEWNDLNKRVRRQGYYIDLKKDKSFNIKDIEPFVTRPVLISGV